MRLGSADALKEPHRRRLMPSVGRGPKGGLRRGLGQAHIRREAALRQLSLQNQVRIYGRAEATISFQACGVTE